MPSEQKVLNGTAAKKTSARNKPRSGHAVTMETVGRLAGVSQVTVSRALNDPSKVSPVTLRKIEEAIAITGFVPNALAGALASRRSKLISALVPSVTNIVYASMAKAFTDEMRAHGYQVLLSETGFEQDEEAALIATHLSRRPDAMLLTGIHHSTEARKMLLAADIPVVEAWDTTDSPIDLCVGFSHVEAGRAVARFAAENGYCRAGNVSAGDERALRRKDAFAAEFQSLCDVTVPEVCFDGAASLARGREGLQRLIHEQNFQGGVIFCSSDLLAHGALIEAQTRGISVPSEIAVIGFGDQDFAAYTAPALTTVRVDRSKLGVTAAQAILSRFEGKVSDWSLYDVGFNIVRRASA